VIAICDLSISGFRFGDGWLHLFLFRSVISDDVG